MNHKLKQVDVAAKVWLHQWNALLSQIRSL
jgi:hypothetical protein